MCLLITVLTAIIFTLIWYFKDSSNEYKVGTLALVYWGAALMWCVDGFFCIAEGEPFLDLSANDALLGLVIAISGLILWTIMLIVKDPKKILKHKKCS